MNFKFTPLLFLIFTFFISCHNNNKSAEENIKQQSTLSEYFYKRLVGTMAGQPITMQLNKVGEDIIGIYYYDKIGKPIDLHSEKFIGDSLILVEQKPNTDLNAKLYLKWNGKGFTGSFIEKNTKNYPIKLIESYPKGSYKFNSYFIIDSTKNKVSHNNIVSYSYLTCSNDWINKQFKNVYSLKSNEDWTTTLKKIANKELPEAIRIEDDTTTKLLVRPSDPKIIGRKMSIYFNEKNLISLCADNNNENINEPDFRRIYNYDIINRKELNLSDIIDIDIPILKKFIYRFYLEQCNLNQKEDFLPSDLPIINNFYLTNKGINLVYDQKNYVYNIDVFLPFSSLKTYLKPAFKQRMEIK